jgi:predicted TPR repeat methyltransferase
MNCCPQCEGADDLFNEQLAEQELADYRRKGPARQTRLLLDELKADDLHGLTLLDIGGGVGAIQHELLSAGLAQVTGVDASAAYLNVARSEAERRGYADRARYHHGDFVALAEAIAPADIVTLDRVICCYPDMPALVALSAERALRFYALVFPCDRWWVKLGIRVMNFVQRLRRDPFRFYAHKTGSVIAIARQNGLEPRFHRRGLLWQVMICQRTSSANGSSESSH